MPPPSRSSFFIGPTSKVRNVIWEKIEKNQIQHPLYRKTAIDAFRNNCKCAVFVCLFVFSLLSDLILEEDFEKSFSKTEP